MDHVFFLYLSYVFEEGMVFNLDELVGSILMGNDEACEIFGMGKIKLKLHDGIVLNLTEVRYIPDLKKNLISFGFLESKGFKIPWRMEFWKFHMVHL